jgi:protein-S-isoprenylcysteine O-methyltransferase Ste14
VEFWVAIVFASLSTGIFIALAVEEEKQLHARFGEGYVE